MKTIFLKIGSKNSYGMGYLYISIMFVVTAISNILCKELFNSGLNTYQVLTYSTIMSLIISGISFRNVIGKAFFDMKINIWIFALICTLGFVVYGIFYNKALELMPVNQVAILYYTNPIFIYIGGVIFLRKTLNIKFNPIIILIATLCFAGVFLVIKGGSTVKVSFNILGLVYILGTILATVAYALLGKKFKIPEKQYLIFGQAILIIVNGIMVTINGWWVSVSIKVLILLLLYGVFNNILIQVMYIKALDNLPVEKFSTLIFISPVVTSLGSVLVLGEKVTTLSLIGMCLVIGSNIFFQPSNNKKESSDKISDKKVSQPKVV